MMQILTNNTAPLMFVHIPKTGGTSLCGVLERQYGIEAIFVLDDTQPHKSCRALRELLDSGKKELKAIRGHLPFGVYGFLPTPFPLQYVSILRHPVDRIVSHYYFVCESPGHYLHEEVTSRKMSLADYVRSGLSEELDNDQTRALSGIGYTCGIGKCSNDMLNTAKKNICDHFTVIGLTERFDETLLLLRKAFHWKLPVYLRRNVTKSRPRIDSLSEETLSAIKRYNALDIELYRFASEVFEEQVARQGPLFEKELHFFRYFNRLYGRYRNIRSHFFQT